MGDTGADVRSLQEELNRLGYNVGVDGSMGRRTLSAGVQSLAAAGIEWRGTTFPASRTVWMPAQQVHIRACDSTLGARVAGGDPIATLSSGHQTISVDNLPDDLVEGPRVVTIGTGAVPVDAAGKSGPIPVDLDARAQDSTDVDASAPKPIAATLSLAEPTRVSSVPPSAIVALSGSHGCVESNGEMLHVQVVGSQLGQTFVQFDRGKSPHHIRLHPARSRCP
jgi:peptidoglycan hydrolase-like protein with peptidoglycan-binding domain